MNAAHTARRFDPSLRAQTLRLAQVARKINAAERAFAQRHPELARRAFLRSINAVGK